MNVLRWKKSLDKEIVRKKKNSNTLCSPFQQELSKELTHSRSTLPLKPNNTKVERRPMIISEYDQNIYWDSTSITSGKSHRYPTFFIKGIVEAIILPNWKNIWINHYYRVIDLNEHAYVYITQIGFYPIDIQSFAIKEMTNNRFM